MNQAAQAKIKSEESNKDASFQRQSQLATAIIGILIIVLGFLTYNFLQRRTGGPEDIVISEAIPAAQITSFHAQTYLVKPGDNLWEIAQKELGNGFRWVEIAELNNIPLDNPAVEPDAVLKLPSPLEKELAPGQPTQAPRITPAAEETAPNQGGVGGVSQEAGDLNGEGIMITQTPETAIGDQTYTVERGDTLWEIAVKFYGDGARWHTIYDANPLSMYTAQDGHTFPLIHAGNVLVIPVGQGAAD